MRRDWLCWVVALMLFSSGVIWARLFGEPEFLPVDSGDLIGLLAAIATAFAALAAWRAAESSKKQLEMTAAQGRAQLFQSHWRSFNECLDETIRELGVSFYNRSELYSAIFPNNRRPDQGFSEIGGVQLIAWHDCLKKLIEVASAPTELHETHMSEWCRDYLMLSNFMSCTALDRSEQQLLMGGEVPSGISFDNFRSVPSQLNGVLNRLSEFAFCDVRTGAMGQSAQFEKALEELINRSQTVYRRDHSYGAGKA